MPAAPDLVTIIIPTYNRASIIADAVKSAIAQDYPNTQIIVVDDGSTDETAAVMRGFANVEYVKQRNQGPAAARNTGLKLARGRYIATLDSDDCWDPGYLSNGLELLRKNNSGLFFANWREAVDDGSITCADYFANCRRLQALLADSAKESHRVLSPAESRKLFLGGLPAPSSGLIMTRDLVGNGWESLHFSEDWLMPLKAVLTQAPSCVFTTKVLWTKRRDGKNIYDVATTSPKLQLKLAEDTERVAERVSAFLSSAEIRELRSTVAERYFDYAYSISSLEPFRAFSFFRKSNRVVFRLRTCAAMVKTMGKAVLRTRAPKAQRPS
jgi:glycosyltransferase involved in cell wall biosynthesis